MFYVPRETHGYFVGGRPRLYTTWSNMIQRCTNPKFPSAKYYLNKGIGVCSDWFYFANFAHWGYGIGNYGVDKQIHRIDNKKNYCPENCIFISKDEHIKITIDERKKSLPAGRQIV